MTAENCPACGRELLELEDFPRIEVQQVELLPLPKKILHWSSRTSSTRKELKEEDLPEELRGARVIKPIQRQEIDLTEEIKKVVDSEPMQQYLEALQQKVGFDVEASEVTPPFLKGRFSWAFAIPDSNYFLSIQNEEEKEGVAILKLWGQGRDRGSARGPTLQAYADIAKIEYQGKLLTVGAF